MVFLARIFFFVFSFRFVLTYRYLPQDPPGRMSGGLGDFESVMKIIVVGNVSVSPRERHFCLGRMLRFHPRACRVSLSLAAACRAAAATLPPRTRAATACAGWRR